MRQKNILIAYFSHKGENYSNGSIVKLEKGNTERAAEILAKVTGGDLFEIRREKKYPFSYKECVSESIRELQENARPKLAEDIDITGYDEIYLGFPNWCGTMPMPVWTFWKTTILPEKGCSLSVRMKAAGWERVKQI